MENVSGWNKAYGKVCNKHYRYGIREQNRENFDSNEAYVFDRFLPLAIKMSTELLLDESDGVDVLTSMLLENVVEYQTDSTFINYLYLRLLNKKQKQNVYNDRFDHYLNNNQKKEGTHVIEILPDAKNGVEDFVMENRIKKISDDFIKNVDKFNNSEKIIMQLALEGNNKREILHEMDSTSNNKVYNQRKTLAKKLLKYDIVNNDEINNINTKYTTPEKDFIISDRIDQIEKHFKANIDKFSQCERELMDLFLQGFNKKDATKLLSLKFDNILVYRSITTLAKKLFRLEIAEKDEIVGVNKLNLVQEKTKKIVQSEKKDVAYFLTQKNFTEKQKEILQNFIDSELEENFLSYIVKEEPLMLKNFCGSYQKFVPSEKKQLKNMFRLIRQGINMVLNSTTENENNITNYDKLNEDEINIIPAEPFTDDDSNYFNKNENEMPVWLL